MWHLKSPAEPAWRTLELSQQQARPTYATDCEPGITKAWEPGVTPAPAGYDVDYSSAVLGSGAAVFATACAGLVAWAVAPPWCRMQGTQLMDSLVRLEFQLLGLRWWSLGKIVYEVGAGPGPGWKRRVGFAYGTLPAHVEIGEERFCITWRDDDTVVYELCAFSRPRYWMARCAKPLARFWQRRFARDSQQALKTYVAAHCPPR
jgi:uncharacterized protein (UPF0548 family)